MQQQINEMAAQIADLDIWTQRSIIGSWAFFANSQCLTQAIRALPDLPVEDSGVDGYTPYEAAIRNLTVEMAKDTDENENKGDFRSNLPAWVALQRAIGFMMTESGGDASGVADTHAFLIQRAPSRDRFEADFAMRVRMGMRPGISRKDFVNAEHAKALEIHEKLVAKGEHAVALVDRMNLTSGTQIERGFDDLPDWASETLLQKLVQKLKDRWTKLEMTRTNPRVNQAKRDESEGDQFLIVEVLKHYNEQIAPVLEEEDDIDS